jgi:hypothetical protein
LNALKRRPDIGAAFCIVTLLPFIHSKFAGERIDSCKKNGIAAELFKRRAKRPYFEA